MSATVIVLENTVERAIKSDNLKQEDWCDHNIKTFTWFTLIVSHIPLVAICTDSNSHMGKPEQCSQLSDVYMHTQHTHTHY